MAETATMLPSGERCGICGCALHRTAGTYALPTPEGRSHATRHHFVAERFFGRSSNRSGTKRDSVFATCPWGAEGESGVFCYECHEELLHNPVFLPDNIATLAQLVKARGISESEKSADRSRLAGRVLLLHEVIAAGLDAVAKKQSGSSPGGG